MYQTTPPTAALSPFVECYWQWEAEALAEGEDLVFPDATPECLIHLGDPPEARRPGEAWHRQAQGFVICAVHAPLQLRPTGRMSVFGIRFRPWGLRRFHSGRAATQFDVSVPLEMFFSEQANMFIDQVRTSEDFKARVAVANYQLSAALTEPHPATETIIGLHGVVRGRQTSARDMAALMATSPRSFARLWQDVVGLQVRTYVRVMRFQNALALMREGEPLAQIATAVDYADQAHMTRDIKRFTGLTPTQLQSYLAGETFENFYANRQDAPWLLEEDDRAGTD